MDGLEALDSLGLGWQRRFGEWSRGAPRTWLSMYHDRGDKTPRPVFGHATRQSEIERTARRLTESHPRWGVG